MADEKHINIQICFPVEFGLSNTQVRFMFYHLFIGSGLQDEEYNEYLSNLPKCEGKTYDDMYDEIVKILPWLKVQIERGLILKKESNKNGQ